MTQIKPYDFGISSQPEKPDQTLAAFINTIALKLGKIYGLNVQAPAANQDTPSEAAYWGVVTEPKSRIKIFLRLPVEPLNGIISKKLGGKFQAGGGKASGAISDELAQKEFRNLLAALTQIVQSFLPGAWQSKYLPYPQSTDLDGLNHYTVSYQHSEDPGHIYPIHFNCDPRLASTLQRNTRSSKPLYNHNQKVSEEGDAIFRHLQTTVIELQAILGEKSLTLREICQLRIGDVLMLDTKKSDGITVRVQGKRVFKAKIGLRNKHFLLKIV